MVPYSRRPSRNVDGLNSRHHHCLSLVVLCVAMVSCIRRACKDAGRFLQQASSLLLASGLVCSVSEITRAYASSNVFMVSYIRRACRKVGRF